MSRVSRADVLDQAEYWTAAGGRRIPLRLMSHSYRVAVLNLLMREARQRMRLYYYVYADALMRMHADDVPNEVFDTIDYAMTYGETDDAARDWLNKKPLIVELRRLIALGEAEVVDGEVVVHETAPPRRAIEQGSNSE